MADKGWRQGLGTPLFQYRRQWSLCVEAAVGCQSSVSSAVATRVSYRALVKNEEPQVEVISSGEDEEEIVVDDDVKVKVEEKEDGEAAEEEAVVKTMVTELKVTELKVAETMVAETKVKIEPDEAVSEDDDCIVPRSMTTEYQSILENMYKESLYVETRKNFTEGFVADECC